MTDYTHPDLEHRIEALEKDALAKRLAEAEAETQRVRSELISKLYPETAKLPAFGRLALAADRDRLSAQVEGLTRERERALQCHGDVPCGACITCLNGKLDSALADLAAERAARENTERELLTLKECIREYPCANGKQHEPAKDCLYCERDAAQAKLAKAVGILEVNKRAWRGLEKMPYETKPESEAALRALGKRQADRIDAMLAEIGGGT